MLAHNLDKSDKGCLTQCVLFSFICSLLPARSAAPPVLAPVPARLPHVLPQVLAPPTPCRCLPSIHCARSHDVFWCLRRDLQAANYSAPLQAWLGAYPPEQLYLVQVRWCYGLTHAHAPLLPSRLLCPLSCRWQRRLMLGFCPPGAAAATSARRLQSG